MMRSLKIYWLPDTMKKYCYFFDRGRAKQMVYPISARQLTRDDNLLNLLSNKSINKGYIANSKLLQQSFMTAGKAFKAIESPTQAVIVPYAKKTRCLIAELGRVAKEFDVETHRPLLRQAQKFSVIVVPNVWDRLQKEDAVHEIRPGEAIYYLDEKYYSDDFGLADKPYGKMSVLSY